MLETEHIFGVEETHKTRLQKLIITYEVVTGKDADVRVEGEEEEKD